MRVAVTGASGLIGSHLVGELERRGAKVVRLGRPTFALDGQTPPALPSNLNALVHCAYDFNAIGPSEVERINVAGSLRLLDAAVAAGVERLVFVSSIAAFDGCRSIYGRGKLKVEEAFRRAGGVVIRPGLIHGDPAGRGMIGALTNAVRLPLVPVFGNGSQTFYLAHVGDVARLLADATGDDYPWGCCTVVAANSSPWTFRELLRELARRSNKGKLIMLPVPVGLGVPLLRVAEGIGLRLPFRSDSLVSMVHYDPSPAFRPDVNTEERFRSFR